MRVITDYPVVYSNACGCGYSSLDGKSSSSEIRDFQSWANSKGYKDAENKALVVDGIWGKRTDFVFKKYGSQWESEKKASTVPVNTRIEDLAKNNTVGEEKKPMSKKTKIAIGIGVFVIFATVAYLALKDKK